MSQRIPPYVITLASLLAVAPASQKAGPGAQRAINDFASFIAAPGPAAPGGWGVRMLVDTIDNKGVQFRLSEAGRFRGEHMQMKTRLDWSQIKSLDVKGTRLASLQLHLSRDAQTWVDTGDGSWKMMHLNRLAYLEFPTRPQALKARDLLAAVIRRLGYKVSIK